jgi:hypothetical protein
MKSSLLDIAKMAAWGFRSLGRTRPLHLMEPWCLVQIKHRSELHPVLSETGLPTGSLPFVFICPFLLPVSSSCQFQSHLPFDSTYRAAESISAYNPATAPLEVLR